MSDPQLVSHKRYIRWSNHAVLQHGPFHDLKKIQPILMMLLSTGFARKLTGETYRRPGLDKPEGESPFLRFLVLLLALTVVLVR